MIGAHSRLMDTAHARHMTVVTCAHHFRPMPMVCACAHGHGSLSRWCIEPPSVQEAKAVAWRRSSTACWSGPYRRRVWPSPVPAADGATDARSFQAAVRRSSSARRRSSCEDGPRRRNGEDGPERFKRSRSRIVVFELHTASNTHKPRARTTRLYHIICLRYPSGHFLYSVSPCLARRGISLVTTGRF